MALVSLLLALLISAQGEVLMEDQVAALWILSGRHQISVLVEPQTALRRFSTVTILTPAKYISVLVHDFPGR